MERPSDEFSSQHSAGSNPTQPKESMMRFYTKQHQFYCGIDLHARLLAICIVDQAGVVVCRTQIPADKTILLDTGAVSVRCGRSGRMLVRLVLGRRSVRRGKDPLCARPCSLHE